MPDLFGLVLPVAPHIQTEGDVFFYRQPGEERGVLKDQPPLGRGAADLRAVHRDAAQRGRDQPGHQPEDGGFSAAGGPHQRDELAAGHGYAHILQRVGDLIALYLGKDLADLFQLQGDGSHFVRHHFSAPFCHLSR